MRRPDILTAITSCGHSIDHDEVVLRFDPKQEGHNALNQLCNRINIAQAEQRGYDLAKADALIAALTEALEPFAGQNLTELGIEDFQRARTALSLAKTEGQ